MSKMLDLERARKIAAAPWLPGSDLAVEMSGPVAMTTAWRGPHKGCGVDPDFTASFARLTDQVMAAPGPSRAFLLKDAEIFGFGFMVAVGDAMLLESHYLARDIDTRLEQPLGGDYLELPQEVTWIVGCNASTSNWWHWVAQALPAIVHCATWLRASGVERIGAVVPRLTTWQRESLGLLGIGLDDVIELSRSQTARAQSAAYSGLLGGANVFGASDARLSVRERLLRSSREKRGSSRPRVLLSRRDSKKRPLLNEDDLSLALGRRGFETICPGELTVAEQIALFANAETIVAPHGAGSAGFLFCRETAQVLELQQTSYVNAAGLSLCKTSGATAWACIFPDDGGGQLTRGWVVDIGMIEATLDMMRIGEVEDTNESQAREPAPRAGAVGRPFPLMLRGEAG